jgi:hypothetical protein
VKVEWSVTGTPSEVVFGVGNAARSARAAHPNANAIIMAARDYQWAEAMKHAADATITASVSLAVVVAATPNEPPATADVVALVLDEDAAPARPHTRFMRRVS